MQNDCESLKTELLNENDDKFNRVHAVNFSEFLDFLEKIERENTAMFSVRDAQIEFLPEASAHADAGLIDCSTYQVTLSELFGDML